MSEKFFERILMGFNLVFGGGIFRRIAKGYANLHISGFVLPINMLFSFIAINSIVILNTFRLTFFPNIFHITNQTDQLNVFKTILTLRGCRGTLFFLRQGCIILLKKTFFPNRHLPLNILARIIPRLCLFFQTTSSEITTTFISNFVQYFKIIVGRIYFITAGVALIFKKPEPLIGDYSFRHMTRPALFLLSGQEIKIFDPSFRGSLGLSTFEVCCRFFIGGMLYLFCGAAICFVEKKVLSGELASLRGIFNILKLFLLGRSTYGFSGFILEEIQKKEFLRLFSDILPLPGEFLLKIPTLTLLALFCSFLIFFIFGPYIRVPAIIVNLFFSLFLPIINAGLIYLGYFSPILVCILAFSIWYKFLFDGKFEFLNNNS
jgi:hypothetical protein